MDHLLHEPIDKGKFLLIATPPEVIEVGQHLAAPHLVLEHQVETISLLPLPHTRLEHRALLSLHLETHLYPAHVHQYFVFYLRFLRLSEHKHVAVL